MILGLLYLPVCVPTTMHTENVCVYVTLYTPILTTQVVGTVNTPLSD